MNFSDAAKLGFVRKTDSSRSKGAMMSFVKKSAATLACLLLCSTGAIAGGVGGGTELPSNAEPNKAKNPSEKSMGKGSMSKGDMQRGESMEKGGEMKGDGKRM